jgi:type II secretory pathway component PulF
MATTDQKETTTQAPQVPIESTPKKTIKKTSKKPLEAIEDMLGIPHGEKKDTDIKKDKKEKKKDGSVKQDTKEVTVDIEKVSISEPVKATPVAPRRIEEAKPLSTFGLGKHRDQFIENLSMLVLSGMAIPGALASIIKQTKSEGMKKILERMLLEIESGSPVWKALDRTTMFKGYTISLIRLGEESGNFAENLKVVALEEEKDREFKSKVKSALMYPIFVLTLTGVVGIGISWFILPKLAKIFFDLKLTLPLITRALINFGLFLNKYGLIAVPLGLMVIGGISYMLFYHPKTKFMGEAIIFSIPGIKTLLMEVEVARFGYLLGTLLEAGLPVTKAIDSLAGASEVLRYKKFYLHLRETVELGNSFQKSFALYKGIDELIPQPIQQLIISGEESGNLNKTLIKVGKVLEAKSDTTTKNLTIIMEPILLVIVWAGVVSVAFAVILPIYSLVGGLNNI